MSTESSLHSNALNFMSFMESGVDSRTGQYTLSIKLPELGANYFSGPELELSLNFNPLNMIDSGWGRGWNLSLTQFAPHTQVITTYSGESFKVTGSSGSRLQMQEQRLAHFHLYREPAGPGGNARYRVVHRSGLVEILEEMGSANGRIALPVEIYAATGHRIDLEYKPFNSSYMMLCSISDERKEILLEIERDDGRIELRERPYQGDNGQPVALYAMNLINTDWVASIVLPTRELASWRLDYALVNGLLCVSKIEPPTGAREYLYYQDRGHLFPGDARPPLPRVTRHVIEPRGGQPAFQRTYTYPGSNNFLGYGAGIGWSDNGLDNLYESKRYDFEYQTVETLRDEDGTALRDITRTFNRFHLLTSTRTVQNNCVHEVTMQYNIKDAPFNQQVSTLQMPIREQTRWSLANNITRSRLETVETTYDTSGNIIWRKLANGVTETQEWYGTQAEDGYPGDANGFVRHLKSKTTTPASSGRGQAPVLTQHYRYKALAPLAGNAITLNPMIVEHSETLTHAHDPAHPLEEKIYYYLDAPKSSLRHGRRYQEVVKRNKLETTTQYQFNSLLDPLGGHQVLETRKTLFGYDGAQRSTVQRRSLLHGEKLYELNENGVHTQWAYDALRRVTEERVSPETPFEAKKRYDYQLCASDADIARARVTNARGITTETELDGLGRPTRESRDNVLEARPGAFYEILAIQYDAYGNRVKESVTDWLEAQQYLHLVTKTRYDDWGEQCCTIGPDDVEQHNVLDPIGDANHQGAIRYSWREAGKVRSRPQVQNRNGRNIRFTHQARAISGKTETWLNLFNKPVLRKRLDALGELIGERRYSYDGLGRTLTETDERNHTTAFSYDAWGRMLTTEQPNKTLLTRTYAEHSAEDLPTRLVVTPANVQLPARQIGAQYFDGLDRLIGTTTGDRTEYFLFRDGESIPRQRINPAGETIELDYNLQLTNEPISNTAPEDHASFAYDPVSARLLSDDNRQCARRFEYNKANQLTAEHWEDKRDGKTWSRIHSSTLQDRLKNTHEPYGEDTTHEYNTKGRLISTLQGQLQAEFIYDDLGRIKFITSHDRASAQALETEIEYDDQDREVKRTWRQPGQPERTQETVWDKDDLLLSRTLQVGGVSRLVEKFGYDSHARLNMYNCTGPDQPRDALGRSIAMQVFNFDAYNNIELTVTSFTGGPAAERATFIHAERDPCQLQRIEYTPPRTEPNPEFSYDANGNLTRDEQARPIRYDSQNRLLGLNDSGAPDTYGYDAGGLLVSRPEAGERTLLLHDGQRLRMAVRDSLQTLYLHHDEQALGQQQKGSGAQSPLLLHTSASHSVIAESQAGSTRAVRYTAYGEQHADDPLLGTLGYNGEALDPDSGWYLLGSGYRAYNPVLMRFHSPDALSPFGAGGLNYYGYCQGNPITFRDPTGHYSIGYSGQSRSLADLRSYSLWQGRALGAIGWIGMGLGILFAAIGTVAAVVVTGGVAAPAMAAAWSAAGGGISGAGAAFSAGVGAIAGVSLATGIKLAATVATATLSVAGTTLQTEGILSGHETRNNIGTILNYSAAIFGLAVGALQLLSRITNIAVRTGSYAVTSITDDPLINSGKTLYDIKMARQIPHPIAPLSALKTKHFFPIAEDIPVGHKIYLPYAEIRR
ncbi:TPA: RHS repeat-associated core domain-containing protein [Pseudomonas putida]